MTFGEVIALGEFAGQAIVNTFTYATTATLTGSGVDIEQANLGDLWYEHVAESWAGAHPAGFLAIRALTTLYGETGDPLTISAYERDLSDFGISLTGTPAGTIPAAVLAFKLSGTPSFALVPDFIPKRGYLSIGPLVEEDITDAGRFEPTTENAGVYDLLLTNTLLELLDSVVTATSWLPARFHRRGDGRPIGAARCQSALWRGVASTRRSRKIPY